MYFRWDVGTRAGAWIISTDATPTSHDFDLYGNKSNRFLWDDEDTSADGDESITINVQAGDYIRLRVRNYDGGDPTDLTLTIEPPAAMPMSTPEPTATPTVELTATPTPEPTATPTVELTAATPTPEPTATPTAPSFIVSGSGSSSDPYLLNPTNVTGQSIRSYVAGLDRRDSVYFMWYVGGLVGDWIISTDATPTSHNFDLYGKKNIRRIGWIDSDTSGDGDESITINARMTERIYLRVRNYDGGEPTNLTLTIEPPAAIPTPEPIPTANSFTSGGSGRLSDPYIIADPTNVTGQSIRNYVVAGLAFRSDFVYFRWDVGDRAGAWNISTDATPTSHDFDLYGRNDQSHHWNGSVSRNGDESITINARAGGYIYIGVRNYASGVRGVPTDLTLTIDPPSDD